MWELPASFLLIKLPRCWFHFKKLARSWESFWNSFFPRPTFYLLYEKYLQSTIRTIHTRRAALFRWVLIFFFFFLPSEGEGVDSILYINPKLNVATRHKWDNLMSWASAAFFVALQQRTTETNNEAKCWTILLTCCVFQRWTHIITREKVCDYSTMWLSAVFFWTQSWCFSFSNTL